MSAGVVAVEVTAVGAGGKLGPLSPLLMPLILFLWLLNGILRTERDVCVCVCLYGSECLFKGPLFPKPHLLTHQRTN